MPRIIETKINPMKKRTTFDSKIIADAVKRMKPRHYFSQPMPEEYSKPFRKAMGHAQPTAMQLAFAKSVGA